MTEKERKAIRETIGALQKLLEDDEYCTVTIKGKKTRIHRALLFGNCNREYIG